jgi:hypothetical protein
MPRIILQLFARTKLPIYWLAPILRLHIDSSSALEMLDPSGERVRSKCILLVPMQEGPAVFETPKSQAAGEVPAPLKPAHYQTRVSFNMNQHSIVYVNSIWFCDARAHGAAIAANQFNLSYNIRFGLK